MPVVLIVVLAAIAAVLVTAYLLDRRARARGHKPRSGGAIDRSRRERRRDLKAAEEAYRDTSWMSFTNPEREERSRGREDQ